MATENLNKPQRHRQIKTSHEVLRQLNRIYREARFGQMETQDMGRYGAFLNLMGNQIKTTDLEERIEALEKIISEKKTNLKAV